MAGRGSTTFQKRQKEQQRKEKRAEKLARRQNRKLHPSPETPEAESVAVIETGEESAGDHPQAE